MVLGFGVVAAVNFYMASLAVGGFHGIVVDNSYVASQKFNSWLEEARKNEALGWTASLSREPTGHLLLETVGVPETAAVTAELRRPIGTKQFASLNFERGDIGSYLSTEEILPGRWTVRLTITDHGQRWVSESEIR